MLIEMWYFASSWILNLTSQIYWLPTEKQALSRWLLNVLLAWNQTYWQEGKPSGATKAVTFPLRTTSHFSKIFILKKIQLKKITSQQSYEIKRKEWIWTGNYGIERNINNKQYHIC